MTWSFGRAAAAENAGGWSGEEARCRFPASASANQRPAIHHEYTLTWSCGRAEAASNAGGWSGEEAPKAQADDYDPAVAGEEEEGEAKV